ncbi:MAG: phage major capsid protein, partial [Pseudomonadota bacterium]
PLSAPAGSKSAGKREPSTNFGGYALMKAHAKGDTAQAHALAEKVYGETSPVTKALATNVATSGEEFIDEELAREFVSLVRPLSVVRAAGAQTINNTTGNYRMSRHTGSAAATYVAEATAPTRVDETTGDFTLSWFTLTKEVEVTRDMIMFSMTDAEAFVANAIAESIAEKEDQQFLRGVASATAPAGISNIMDANNKFAANATVNPTNIEDDVLALIQRLLGSNIRPTVGNGAFFMPSRVLTYLMRLRDGNGNKIYEDLDFENGRLHGFRVFHTENIPSDLGAGSNETEVYFVKADEIVIGDAMGRMELNSSEHAEFSKRMVVFQGVARHDINMLRTAGAAMLTGVTWGA